MIVRRSSLGDTSFERRTIDVFLANDERHGCRYGCAEVCCFLFRRAVSSSRYCSSVRNAMSVQPWPISSMVRLPQPIHAVGSGLCRLAAVLSWIDTVCRIVPAGKRCGVLYL